MTGRFGQNSTGLRAHLSSRRCATTALTSWQSYRRFTSTFSGTCASDKRFFGRVTRLTLTLGRQPSRSALVNVEVQATLGFWCVCHYLHPHLFLAAFPLSPVHPLLLAQKDLWRGFDVSLVGALRLLPVALFAFALPLAVKPAPLLTGNFSPLPTERLGKFFLGITHSFQNVDSQPG